MTPKRAKAYGKYFMASTDTDKSLAKAEKLGLRTFHVSARPNSKAIECPNTTHHVACAQCLLCSGTSKKAKSIYIAPHGTKKKHVINQTK